MSTNNGNNQSRPGLYSSISNAQVYDASSGGTAQKGEPGASAYEIAVLNGYVGTEEEWLESLKGGIGAKLQNNAEIFNDYYANDTNIAYGRISGNNNAAVVYGLEVTGVNDTDKSLTFLETPGLAKGDTVAFWTWSESKGYYRQLRAEVLSVSGRTIELDTTTTLTGLIKPRSDGGELSTDIAAGYWIVPYTDTITNATRLTFEHENDYFSVGMDGASNKGFIWSLVSGWGNKALALGASVFGGGNTAKGERSFAIGYKTKANGHEAFSSGEKTEANGYASRAKGRQTKANGDWSDTSGIGTIAVGEGQTVVGIYNEPKYGKFIIGCGSSDDARKNALEVINDNVIVPYHLQAENVGATAVQSDIVSVTEDLTVRGTVDLYNCRNLPDVGSAVLSGLKSYEDAVEEEYNHGELTDDNWFIAQRNNGGKDDKEYFRKPISKIWGYILQKILQRKFEGNEIIRDSSLSHTKLVNTDVLQGNYGSDNGKILDFGDKFKIPHLYATNKGIIASITNIEFTMPPKPNLSEMTLTDKTTRTEYKLVVDNGVLSIEKMTEE